jgi:argininosuccinate lyase
MKKTNMWAGRFESGMDPDMQELSYSVHYDKELYWDDIEGSIAHTKALQEAGVLKAKEQKAMVKALKQIRTELEQGVNLFTPEDEDIHMAVERVLTERIGDLGKKLHTGRSRNDQVATDFRLYIRRNCEEFNAQIVALQKALYQKAVEYQKAIMPGYTHLQQAQPIYISHYLLSFFWALERDKKRFINAADSAGDMPLGSGALAGSAFPYDRKQVAKALGFKRVSDNSIDATAHRDYAMEFLSATAILGNLLSRYAEDFVTWSSQEFGYLELGDAWTTGSSMMPQKKNPDSMELIRGRSGRLLGNFSTLYTVAKGAPLCYSRDLQEDKEPVFDSVKTLDVSLRVMEKAVASMSFNGATIESKMHPGMLATDLADELVNAGIPFREAHDISGALIRKAEKAECSFLELPAKDWEDLPGGEGLKKKLTFVRGAERRSIQGGTGQKSIRQQLAKAKRVLKLK